MRRFLQGQQEPLTILTRLTGMVRNYFFLAIGHALALDTEVERDVGFSVHSNVAAGVDE